MLQMQTISAIRLANLLKLLEEGFTTLQLAGGKSTRSATLKQIIGGRQISSGKPMGVGDPLARAVEQAAKKPIGWMDNVHDKDGDEDYATCPQFEVTAAMGAGAINPDYVELRGNLKFKRSFLADEGIREANGQVVYARGDSMSPTIPDGSVVLVNTADTAPRHGKVYLINDKEAGLRIKRLLREREGWLIKCDNPDEIKYPPEPFVGDLHTICGRAAWYGARL